MSARALDAVFNSSLPKSIRLCALALAWFANDEGGRVFPSVGRLARMVGCDERSVRRELAELRRLGVLRVVCASVGGPGRTTEYRIDLERLANPDADVMVNPDTQVRVETAATLTPVSANPDASVRTTLTPVSGDQDLISRDQQQRAVGFQKASTRLARETIFSGAVLRVTARMHSYVLPAAGNASDLIDWQELYRTAERHYAEHGQPADRIADLKQRASAAAQRKSEPCSARHWPPCETSKVCIRRSRVEYSDDPDGCWHEQVCSDRESCQNLRRAALEAWRARAARLSANRSA
jgi:hypothetical protein